jgi:hypothetical protein
MKSNRRSRRPPSSKQEENSSREQSDRPYPVGYGKPPVTSRFKPGASGNVKGRPKNSKNLKTLIRQAMTAKIAIQEGSNSRRVTKIEGVVLRQIQSALKGDDRSAMAVIKMAAQLGLLDDPNGDPTEAAVFSPADEQILEQLLTRHHKAKRR